ncbi:MAG: FtsL-like putative cell division protein [Flavobacteriales bacterium]
MSGNQFIEDGAVETPKKSTSSAKKVSAWSQILNGEFLTKDFVLNNLGYILFFFFLLFILVAKGYYGKSLLKDIQEHRKVINQNTANYIEVKTMLEEKTKRSKMTELLVPLQLKEAENAIKVIKSDEIKSLNEER